MFERNRVDSISDGVPVEIALADGETIKGKLMVPPAKAVADALTGPAPSSSSSPTAARGRS